MAACVAPGEGEDPPLDRARLEAVSCPRLILGFRASIPTASPNVDRRRARRRPGRLHPRRPWGRRVRLGPVPGAVSIPMVPARAVPGRPARPAGERVICRSGARSAQVVQWLQPAGVRHGQRRGQDHSPGSPRVTPSSEPPHVAGHSPGRAPPPSRRRTPGRDQRPAGARSRRAARTPSGRSSRIAVEVHQRHQAHRDVGQRPHRLSATTEPASTARDHDDAEDGEAALPSAEGRSRFTSA